MEHKLPPQHQTLKKYNHQKKSTSTLSALFGPAFSAIFFVFSNTPSPTRRRREATRSAFQGTVEDHVPHVFQDRILYLKIQSQQKFRGWHETPIEK